MALAPLDSVFFRFRDPGRLVDRELELVAPHEQWIDEMLIAAAHACSQGDERADAMTRASLLELLKLAPNGRERANPARGRVPSYSFWMRLNQVDGYRPPVPMGGSISLRISDSRDVELYFGHLGYNVFPPARGRHLAERACRLLIPLATSHGLEQLWITCNPDNIASRRTCERLGARYVETVDLPRNNVLYQRGERQKCRYCLPLANAAG